MGLAGLSSSADPCCDQTSLNDTHLSRGAVVCDPLNFRDDRKLRYCAGCPFPLYRHSIYDSKRNEMGISMTPLGRQPSASRPPLVGIPGYWHESETILGRQATAVPDSYIRAVLKSELLPLIIPVVQSEELLRQYLSLLDGLLLIGGPDIDPVHYGQKPVEGLRRITPERDQVELQAARWALDAGLPILAICRGIQVLSVATGGTLWQDIASQRPQSAKHDFHPGYPESHLAHKVRILPDSRLAGILKAEAVWVNSLHHQAIKRMGEGLRATAYAPDGIIEAVEGTGSGWTLGVQWHPEWLVERDRGMLALFQSFRSVCAGKRHEKSPAVRPKAL